MIVLGVDPGTLITGYGVLQRTGDSINVLACDAIVNSGADPMPRRLQKIFTTLSHLIERYHPDEFAIETAFYGKNAQSALKLGQARGVAILAGVLNELEAAEYSPREVKKAITGNGTASNQQVQAMMLTLLALKSAPRLFDITDALAVGFCHLNRTGKRPGSRTSWKSFVQSHPERIRKTGAGGRR